MNERRIKIKHRPAAAAQKLGISVATLWRLHRNDPTFPKFVKLTERCTVIDDDELDAYVEKRDAETSEVAEVAIVDSRADSGPARATAEPTT